MIFSSKSPLRRLFTYALLPTLAALCLYTAVGAPITAQSDGEIDWRAISDLAAQAQYKVVWQEPPGRIAGFYATNRSHNFMAGFTVYGLHLSPRQAERQIEQANWSLSLRPVAIGATGALESLPLSARALSGGAQRVEIEWSDLLTEWYLNEAGGIEHGFIVHQRPPAYHSASSPGMLAIELRVETNLTPFMPHGGEVRFQSEWGTDILRYSSLYVFDASGRTLPAHFNLGRTTHNETILSILIEESDARYPITVDPLITGYERRLTASDGTSGDQFGAAVALSGNTLVVGAPNADVGINLGQGAAYVFERNQGGLNGWGEVKRLLADDGAPFDAFGGAVAIDGDLIVVGAAGDNVGEKSDQGAAYLFGRNHGGKDAWGQVRKLLAADGAAFDRFGIALDIAGRWLVIGAPGANVENRNDQGAAYLFDRNHGGADGWGQIQRLVASDGAASSFFGEAAAMTNEMMIIGAGGARIGENPGQGAAYLFTYNQSEGIWSQVMQLSAADGAPLDRFGAAVAVAGERVLVGAPGVDIQGRSDQGAAYLFERDQGSQDHWVQIKKLIGTGGASNDRFGSAVALDGDTALAGARFSNVGPKNDQGSVYLFERNQGGADVWGQLTRITGSDGAANDGFGAATALAGGVVVAGAPGKDIAPNFDQGAAYLFDLEVSRTTDLHIAKSVTPPVVAPGDLITYTIDFKNQGPGGALGIRIEDALPLSVSMASVITSVVGQGVQILSVGDPPHLAWGVPWLDWNNGGQIILVGLVRADWTPHGATLTNTVVITAANEISPVNNTASAAVRVITPPARLTVTKVVVNDNGGAKQADDFPIFVNGATVTSGQPITLSAGAYTVTETSAAGYVASFSGDCAPNGRVMLTSGSIKSCTITNSDQPATLTVTKVVINDDGGTLEVSDFPLFVNGMPATSGVAIALDAGVYTVSEGSAAGYIATFSGDCDASGQVLLDVGDAKSCTMTNDDAPSGGAIYLPIVAQ